MAPPPSASSNPSHPEPEPPTANPPLAILFDVGGVLVNSPIYAIADYEKENDIPAGWVNFAISSAGRRGGSDPAGSTSATRTAPGRAEKSKHHDKDGAWQRLERGELSLTHPTHGDRQFFTEFAEDLHHVHVWREFLWQQQQPQGHTHHPSSHPPQPQHPLNHRTAAAETPPPPPKLDARTLFTRMMSASSDPDPYMYPALLRLRASGRFALLAGLSNTVILAGDDPWDAIDGGSVGGGAADGNGDGASRGSDGGGGSSDGANSSSSANSSQNLNDIREKAEAADTPTPAPENTNINSGKTTPNPKEKSSIKTLLNPFISSAHVGLRKPEPGIYKVALERMCEELERQRQRQQHEHVHSESPQQQHRHERMRSESEQQQKSSSNTSTTPATLNPQDILFLDDIGANLKGAREIGMRTLKVADTRTAVRELERVTGLRLLDDGDGDAGDEGRVGGGCEIGEAGTGGEGREGGGKEEVGEAGVAGEKRSVKL
ncbi:MAG: hypothetical protein M1831_001769 [Alyxoria varia]|nr:MAG: hypothetical protein M1831_001769 [Alyxoria varia]